MEGVHWYPLYSHFQDGRHIPLNTYADVSQMKQFGLAQFVSAQSWLLLNIINAQCSSPW